MGICYKIEKLIESRHINKTRLAEQLDISRDTVYNWTDENIKASILMKLSDILQVDMMYFFSDNKKNEVNEDPQVYQKANKKKISYKLSDIDKMAFPDGKSIEIYLK